MNDFAEAPAFTCEYPVDRRRFAAALVVGLVALPLAVHAQQVGKVWQLGYLSPAAAHNPVDEAFERSLANLGYVEGKNIRIERRYTNGHLDQFPGAVADIIRLNVDLIVAAGPAALLAAKNATGTIPIVFLAGGGGVASKVIASLPRLGGNATGVTFYADTKYVEPKHLQLLKELLPSVSRAALLRTSEDTTAGKDAAATAAESLGIRLTVMSLRGPEDLAEAFAGMEKQKPQALVVNASSLLYAHRREFVEFAAKARLPAMYGLREVVPDGGLMSLSPSLTDIAVRCAFYVDKILKGAKPADLPVEQPTKFELVINAKTAKTLGLTIPHSLLLRADQVIE
jgi:putative ABC transport system substrate-binding protein